MPKFSMQSAYALSADMFSALSFEEDSDGYGRPNRVSIHEFGARKPIAEIHRYRENIRLCASPRGIGQFVVLSRRGDVEYLNQNLETILLEMIPADEPPSPSQSRHDFLNSIRLIDGRLYACGMAGQVFSRSNQDGWRLISKELRIYNQDQESFEESFLIRDFTNVDGIDKNAIFVDGAFGSLFFFDGNVWRQVKTTTNASLGEMLFTIDNKMLLAGSRSTILVGSIAAGFTVFRPTQRDLLFYDIAVFQTSYFLATDQGVFRLDPALSEIYSINLGRDREVFSLQVVDNVMWAFGPNFCARYSKNRWTEIEIE